MKTILIPTDLSPEAENAYRYAIDFVQAQPEKVRLVVLLVSEPGLKTFDSPKSLLTDEQLKHERELVARLNLMVDKYQLATGINAKIFTTRGPISEQIVKMAGQLKADYIFMGTKGAHGLKATLQGSYTAAVVAEATCPVLAIPEKSYFAMRNSIVFASDLNDSELGNIHKAIDLAKHNSARVVLLHLSDKKAVEEGTQALEWMRELVKNENNYPHIEIKAVPAHDFTHDLTAQLRRLQAGMLVMTPRKHSYFRNLLGLSHTRAMLHEAILPVLALPTRQAIVTSAATDLLEETALN